jgi:hypothetical protein
MLNEANQVGYTNIFAKEKLSLAFLTAVVFFVRYYSVFGRQRIIEFFAFGQ